MDDIQIVVEWGRQHQTNITDIANEFDQIFVDRLRRHLRSLFTDSHRGVYGSWRQGYSITLPSGESVGVTNGYGSFKVFYHPATEASRRIAGNVYADMRTT
jgi:hypothetical protein